MFVDGLHSIAVGSPKSDVGVGIIPFIEDSRSIKEIVAVERDGVSSVYFRADNRTGIVNALRDLDLTLAGTLPDGDLPPLNGEGLGIAGIQPQGWLHGFIRNDQGTISGINSCATRVFRIRHCHLVESGIKGNYGVTASGISLCSSFVAF